ncbi:hypothetical protein NDU88_001951 [Pleurodeles waltl]|uniref:Uncharacterized protein n=1 Tax=Pleurodeles waltl TaxID=8319 RepID=A0AAV7LB33_PLEWA|nr:hypothetical protein NDU88_001951 [Pleurodeles waltl]
MKTLGPAWSRSGDDRRRRSVLARSWPEGTPGHVPRPTGDASFYGRLKSSVAGRGDPFPRQRWQQRISRGRVLLLAPEEFCSRKGRSVPPATLGLNLNGNVLADEKEKEPPLGLWFLSVIPV